MSLQTLSIDFTNPTNFTFDSDLIEFTDSQKPQLKYLPDADIQLYASFTNDQDANYSIDSVTGTLNGSASVSGGELVLSGNSYCDWSHLNMANVLQQGCVMVRFKPNYTGNAVSFQQIFKSNNNTLNQIYMRHNANLIQAVVNDSSGSTIFSLSFVFSATAGTTYEFALDFDATSGTAQITQDGVVKDTDTGTGTRGACLDYIRSGNTTGQDMSILDILIYDTVQHSGAYTPDWSDIPETKYTLTNPSIVYNIATPMNDLDLYELDTYSIDSNGTVKGTIIQDGQDKYYNSGWVDSDATYAQSNTESELNANISSMVLDYDDMSFRWFLHSEDGSTNVRLDGCSIGYSVMDFVVEDGTSKTDATSYATVAQYRQYWLNKGTIITDTTEQIQGYLNAATEYLDITYDFEGQKTDIDQALEWPRYGVTDRYNYTNVQGYPIDTDVVPQQIIDATCYLAAQQKEESLNIVDDGVKAESYGGVSKTYNSSSSSKKYPAVDKLVKWFILQGNRMMRVN